MQKVKDISFNTATFISVIIICTAFMFPPNCIIAYDVLGYYLYLPNFFIHHSFVFHDISWIENAIKEYHNTPSLYQVYASEVPGNYIDRYPIGMAILYSPFFLIGYIYSLLFHFPADGFSAPFHVAMFMGSIVYSIVSVWLLRNIINKIFNSNLLTAIVSVIIYFGTNYYFHVAFDGNGAMSHNYLFTLYLIIIYLTIGWHEKPDLRKSVLIGLLAGLLTICRPTEIVVVFIPLLWGVLSVKNIYTKIFSIKKIHIAAIFFSFIIFPFLQMLYWKLSAGKWLYYSYGNNAGEGLDLFSPHTIDVLFSFRKGFFIYVPIMILAVSGIILLYIKKHISAIAVVIYFLLNLYLVSSWSCWWYAESFGPRALIPSYAVLSIPLAFFINRIIFQKKNAAGNKIFLTIFCTFCIALNLFQTWQIRKGILHLSRMTKDYYFASFMQTEYNPAWEKLLLVNRSFEGEEKLTAENDYKISVDSVILFPKNNILNKENLYSDGYANSYKNITEKDHAWFRISCKIKSLGNDSNNLATLVCCFMHKGFAYKYKAKNITEQLSPGSEWKTVTIDYITPEVRSKNDELKTYIWYRGNSSIIIDSLHVKIFEMK